MCDVCVMQEVGKRLGRRGMLAAAAGFTAAAALSAQPASGQPIRASGFSRVLDLTHALGPDFPTFGGQGPAIEINLELTFAKDGYNVNKLAYYEHIGTHFDAPIHFSADRPTVDQIPVEQLVCPLVVLDVRQRAEADPDYRVSAEDIAAHEASHGRIPQGACVALNSGWDAKVSGPGFRNADASGAMRFPGFRPDIVPVLMERGVAGVAVDTLSLDHGGSKDFGFHLAWLGAGRWGIECVAGLGQVPPTGATLVAGAPKIRGGTGGPGRVIALV